VKLLVTALLCAGLTVAGCGGGGDASSGSSSAAATATTTASASGDVANVAGPGPEVKLSGPPPKKIEVKDLKKGTGAKAKVGDEAFIRYVGARWNGEIYSNSWTYSSPPSFVLGAHELTIGGLENGIEGMRVGGRREIVLPPSAHIRQNVKNESPEEVREETLAYVVDLIKVKPEFRKLREMRALTGR
jgi:peptidylprolyl isomerase